MANAESHQVAAKDGALRGALKLGTRLRNYELVAVLGQGAFGITYRARDITLNRDVAIKEYLPTSLALREDGATVLPRSTELAEEFIWGRERFLDEARTLATLGRAPAVARVHDFLEAHGTAYIVMELAVGETLEHRIRHSGPPPPAEIERVLPPLLDGLEQVHAVGFLHRDIKPANIILDADGKPTLIDFGASRAAMASRTSAMTAVFTPGYAAPEQYTSGNQGPWTDIYGLSATLHHAIAGQVPPSSFERVLSDTYRPLALRTPAGFRSGLLAGIDKGLAVHAADRPRSIAVWRTILAQAATADTAQTVVIRPKPEAAAPARGRGLSIGLAVAAALILTGGAFYFVTAERSPPAAASGTIEAQAAAAEAQRQAERQELERLRAESEARQKAEAQAAAQHRIDEELRQRSELEAALKRQVEMEVQRRLDAQAAERKRLEEETARRAEAEAAARREAGEKDLKGAEAAEAALRLGLVERQHLQVALTSLRFDTRGTDGVLRPRSREMIGAWQRTQNQPATGFLTPEQKQALLQQGAPAIARHIEEQKKPAVEAKKPDDAKATPAPTTNPLAPFDGDYVGILGGQQFRVRVANGTGSGSWLNTTCSKDIVFTLTIEPNGNAQMRTLGFNKQCVATQSPGNHGGRVTDNQIVFTIKTSTGQDAKVIFMKR